ncbi:MAG: hypothetical protein LAP87_16340 [Acidobacteriia bacterium]|nr:hypothetical protein [Terriglobia bacterium]
MPAALHRIAALPLLCCAAFAGDGATWTAAKSEHFEVYSQAGERTARLALMWFEQLRACFERQTGFDLSGRPAVRVIAFRSTKDYAPYRLRWAADAYYAGTESRDYIVMTVGERGDFQVAAHEYAHLVLHAAGLQLPPWLGEGLAEVFSTIRLGEGASQLSGRMASTATWRAKPTRWGARPPTPTTAWAGRRASRRPRAAPPPTTTTPWAT